MLEQESQCLLEEVASLIEKTKAVDSQYDADNRFKVREKLVIPLDVRVGQKVLHGFSRNLSPAGACIVTHEPIEVGIEAHLQMCQPDGTIQVVKARCRWTRAFGAAHCISGWQFLRLV